MTVRLPPLNSFRFFEAAARHRSFTRAGEELFVTHSAVSQQIKTLEEALGVVLFKRRGSEMQLTLEGTRLLAYVREAMLKLQQGVARVSPQHSAARFVVSAHPAFASRWLVPRLANYAARYPHVQFRLQSSLALTDFTTVDIALRFGGGDWAGLTVHRLFGEEFYPVCSPGYQAEHALHDGNLADAQLLHDERFPWSMWFALDGVDEPSPDGAGLFFSDAGQLLEAAAAGHGVALARSRLCEQDLANGKLVRVSQRSVTASMAYYAVHPPRGSDNPDVADFLEWLHSQVTRPILPP